MTYGRDNTARSNLVSLNIACPHCAARYELPPRLLGPGGAAVRCPRCAGQFNVTPEGSTVPGAPGPKGAATPAAMKEAAAATPGLRATAAGQRPAPAAEPRPATAAAASRPPAEPAGPGTPGPARTAAGRGETQAHPQPAARGAATTRTQHGSPAVETSVAWRVHRAAPVHEPPAKRPPPSREADDDDEMTSDPHAIARRVLDELAAKRGPAMEEARAKSRLFAEFGPDLSAAFDEYRRLSGGSGNPAPFRAVLRERWGIDLG
jgi:predicted Zn finger-like uncharacterized protein